MRETFFEYVHMFSLFSFSEQIPNNVFSNEPQLFAAVESSATRQKTV